MVSQDDIHDFEKKYVWALERVSSSSISDRNKELITGYLNFCKKRGNKLSTRTSEIDIVRRTAEIVQKDLDVVTEADFDKVLNVLELEKKNTYNYIKFIKKFFNWQTDGTGLGLQDALKKS